MELPVEPPVELPVEPPVVRVGVHMGPYGPIWALMGPPGQVLEDYVNFP